MCSILERKFVFRQKTRQIQNVNLRPKTYQTNNKNSSNSELKLVKLRVKIRQIQVKYFSEYIDLNSETNICPI